MKPPKLLRGKRFEQKPKVVKQSPQFDDYCGVKYNAKLRQQLYEIIDCIENGQLIPEEYYQSQIDKQGDRLLRELGIKHLHLDGQGSDIIAYFAEFGNWVELVEINTHVHLESEPRGKELKGIFRAAVGAVLVGAAVGAALPSPSKKSGKRK